MKLDRNINTTGKGKYALINLRKVDGDPRTAVELAAAILNNPQCVEFGQVGSPDEFWVVKLKDENAEECLYAYAAKAVIKDPEFAGEIILMAERAGPNSIYCKNPD